MFSVEGGTEMYIIHMNRSSKGFNLVLSNFATTISIIKQ